MEPRRWCIVAGHTTETTHGTAAPMVPVRLIHVALRPWVPTAARKPVKRTTHPLGPMRVAHQLRTPTAPKKPARRTTQTPGPTALPIKVPTPMGALEARCIQRTARLQLPSIKQLRKEPLHQRRTRAVARLLPARESTTALPWVRPPVVTSTLQRTAKPTATPEAAGNKRVEALAIPPLLKAGDNRKRAAGHRPSAEAVVAGNPGRIVLVARQAEAVVAAGAAAGEPDG